MSLLFARELPAKAHPPDFKKAVKALPSWFPAIGYLSPMEFEREAGGTSDPNDAAPA